MQGAEERNKKKERLFGLLVCISMEKKSTSCSQISTIDCQMTFGYIPHFYVQTNRKRNEWPCGTSVNNVVGKPRDKYYVGPAKEVQRTLTNY